MKKNKELKRNWELSTGIVAVRHKVSIMTGEISILTLSNSELIESREEGIFNSFGRRIHCLNTDFLRNRRSDFGKGMKKAFIRNHLREIGKLPLHLEKSLSFFSR